MLFLLAVPLEVEVWNCLSAGLRKHLLRRCGLSGEVGGSQCGHSLPVPNFLIFPYILALRSFHGTSLGSRWEV